MSTALHLARLRPQRAQQLMGVHGRKLVAELNGISCYPFEPEHSPAKSILRSRTFGEDTNQAHVLEAAVATFSAQAAFRLRRGHLLVRRIGLFMNTNRHKPGYRRWVREITLGTPTNDSGLIISLLNTELGNVFSPRQMYHRLGVFLYDLVPDSSLQTDLLGLVDVKKYDKAQSRMHAIDHINTRIAKGKVYYAAQDLAATWQPKHHIRSPRYLSNWSELPAAHIKLT